MFGKQLSLLPAFNDNREMGHLTNQSSQLKSLEGTLPSVISSVQSCESQESSQALHVLVCMSFSIDFSANPISTNLIILILSILIGFCICVLTAQFQS